MPSPQQVDPHIVTAATQIAERFFRFIGWMHLGEEIGAQQLRQLESVTTIRLDSRPRPPWRQRGRHHLADHALLLQQPRQHVTGGPRFVAAPYLEPRCESLEVAPQTADRLRCGVLGPLNGRLLTGDKRCHLAPLLVCVHPHPGDTVRAHDRLLSYAALTPRGVNPRSSVALRRHLSGLSREMARRYDREPAVPYCLANRGRQGC